MRFKVSVEPVRRSTGTQGSPFDFVDADIMDGKWTWTTGPKGLRFVPLKKLHISPTSLLEVAFLIETGHIRLRGRRSAVDLANDHRWRLDEPSSANWFEAACDLSWTRDPFDRLLAAHARLRRWKLATADDLLLERLAPAEVLAL